MSKSNYGTQCNNMKILNGGSKSSPPDTGTEVKT